MFLKLTIGFLVFAIAAFQANAESHTVTFTNNCGYGTPTLKSQTGETLSTGGAWTSSGSALGGCGDNGEYCTLVEATLENGGSAADISLIPPHEFSVTSGFGYYDGCDGTGTDCTSSSCAMAYRSADDNFAIVGCGADNVNLAITFCD
ncbi:hypothetical protein DAEQUDRAFT_746718 [Daedalea quercina L-15889]|uniref:Glycopeptide n=1 Tax=Daedalea quercina L-15889 TaxID=1314783 RepID=A0A165MV17_9APHY|nr:hypothetical protein DAEQUDRAFT_746718 [Daedalea quercina L-15889]